MNFSTWHILNWKSIKSTNDLFAFQARQLKRKDENLNEANFRLRRLKKENKNLFDSNHQIRLKSFNAKNFVFAHDTKLNNRHDLKLTFKWFESFKIAKTISNKSTFMLSKLNETFIDETYANNRLKRWVQKEKSTTLERETIAKKNVDTNVNENNDKTSIASFFLDQSFVVILSSRSNYEYQNKEWM